MRGCVEVGAGGGGTIGATFRQRNLKEGKWVGQM